MFNQYNELLKENCIRMKQIYNELKTINENKINELLNNKNPQRNNINEKIKLYDNISKEIVSNLDTISNCNLLNDNKNEIKDIIFKYNEGPDFINQNYINSYNKLDNYYFIDNTSDLSNKKLISDNYTDISKNSDLSFLSYLN